MSMDYTHTLRLPRTDFPMRAVSGGADGEARLLSDLAGLQAGLGTQARAEVGYRSLRNAFRWMLGCLAHGGAGDEPCEAPALERHVLSLLPEPGRMDAEALCAFAREGLSAFYFDVRKDALYCDPASSGRRLACLETMRNAFHALAGAASEWTPNLVDEARACLPGWAAEPSSAPDSWGETTKGWDRVMQVRQAVNALLERARTRRELASSLEAAVTLHVPPDMAEALAASGWQPEEVLVVSQAVVLPGREFSVAWRPAEGLRCARSWRYSGDVGADPAFPDLSARDALAVAELQLAR